MNKQAVLQKRLIKLGLIAAISVAVMGAAVFAVYAWSSSLQEDLQKEQAQLNGIRSNAAMRQEQNEQAKKYLELYKTISADNKNSRLSSLNRETAQTWIAEAARHFGLVSLDGSFDPVLEITQQDFKKKTLQGITSNVQLKIGSLTDEDVLRFMDSLLLDFPGYVKIKKFSMTKKAEITPEMLVAISNGNITPLVEATVDFEWLGVKELPQTQPVSNAEGVEP